MKIPSGWRLVPIEPTREMLEAGKHSTATAKTLEACDRAIYAAMIRAAPTHPTDTGSVT